VAKTCVCVSGERGGGRGEGGEGRRLEVLECADRMSVTKGKRKDKIRQLKSQMMVLLIILSQKASATSNIYLHWRFMHACWTINTIANLEQNILYWYKY
jgi:hypothetical protein